MKILLLEPFFTGSHKQWAESLAQYSSHQVEILSLPGRHWKWRMHGAAVSFANQVSQITDPPDLILATDMLDVSTFRGLLAPKFKNIPVVTYFHENQLTYPWSPSDPDPALKRDNHYAFINYTSALASEHVLFNSDYHQQSFLDALPPFLQNFPDFKGIENVQVIKQKSSILPLGLDLRKFDAHRTKSNDGPPIILWNHRWEFDKNPAGFLAIIEHLALKNIDFRLVILGESYGKRPPEFDIIKEHFGDKILHMGFVKSFEEYASWLWKADILPVTSNQDFFGISTVEGIYCENIPILPNRLAFPMHIPSACRTEILYEDIEDLKRKMEIACTSESIAFQPKVKEKVMGYDWNILADKYDQLFDSFKATSD